MSGRTAASIVRRPTTPARRIIDALRFLQGEAERSGLEGACDILRQAEQALAGASPAPEGVDETAELMAAIAGPADAGPTERGFRLRAMCEVSAGLSTSQLVTLAYMAEERRAHLEGFLAMFSEDVGGLPAA